MTKQTSLSNLMGHTDLASVSNIICLKRWLLLLISTSLFVSGQPWAATSYIYVNPTNSVHNPDPQQYIESTTGSVSYSGNATQAYANAATGDLKVRTSVQQTTGGFFNQNGRTQVSAYNTAIVGAGSSGLSTGDSVTLSLSISLDGLLDVSVGHPIGGFDPIYDGGSGIAGASLRDSSFFFLKDMTPYDNGEGGISFNSTTAVEFQPWAALGLDGSWRDPNWEYVLTEGWGWTLTNNLGTSLSDGVLLDPYNPNIINCADGSGSCPNRYEMNFNTGLLNIDFQTSIGNTLALSGLLEVLSDGINGGSEAVVVSASTDFMDTFNVDIKDPYGTGIELTYELAPTVPVPAAVWLFGSGLLGLIGIARRKKA